VRRGRVNDRESYDLDSECQAWQYVLVHSRCCVVVVVVVCCCLLLLLLLLLLVLLLLLLLVLLLLLLLLCGVLKVCMCHENSIKSKLNNIPNLKYSILI